MNAADVTQGIVSREQFVAIIDALRAACGGGDIVIRADGTLAKLRFDGTVESSGHWVPLIAVVPVECGA